MVASTLVAALAISIILVGMSISSTPRTSIQARGPDAAKASGLSWKTMTQSNFLTRISR